MISRELLKEIGFVKAEKFTKKFGRETWRLQRGNLWDILIGYGDYEGVPYFHGDTASVADLILHIMREAETAIDKMESGDDW